MSDLYPYSWTTIYVRFRVEESGLSLLCGLPRLNVVGLKLLASLVKAELRLANIQCQDLHHFGELNLGNMVIATEQPFPALRCLRRVLEECGLFAFATIFYYDPSEDWDRRYNRGADVDPDAPFVLDDFMRETHALIATSRKRGRDINELLATLPKPLLPPISAP